MAKDESLTWVKEFQSGVATNYPTIYLTLISIIQGVALGCLSYQTWTIFKDKCLLQGLLFLPYAGISLGVLIIVVMEYSLFVLLYQPKSDHKNKLVDYRQFLGWRPTAIPFVLGILEVGPMLFMDKPKYWWIATGLFCFFGIFAFINSIFISKHMAEYRHSKHEPFFKKDQQYLGISALITGILSALSFVVSQYVTEEPYGFTPEILVTGLFLFGLGLMFWLHNRYLQWVRNYLISCEYRAKPKDDPER
jgi:hypothetical protein